MICRQPGYPVYESATHSSDNYFLQVSTLASSYFSRYFKHCGQCLGLTKFEGDAQQNATSTMNATQAAVAHEWRAYVASFIRHSE